MDSKIDATQLQKRLEELHSRLARFDRELKENFSSLDSSWHRLDRSWDGQAYDQFNSRWQKSRRLMETYIELSKKYEAFLEERIASLKQFEKR